jgi:long-chain acyl-CoA synthetase
MNTFSETRSDPIPAAAAETLPGLFHARAARTPDLTAYRQFDAAASEWVGFTWVQAFELIERWQRPLAALGLAPGERVAVQLRNRLEWVCYEQAALALGLVVVPLYPDDNPGNVAYILADSGSQVLLVDRLARWQALAPLRERFPALTQVLCLERAAAARAGPFR